jgi:hypothetical protein
MTSVYIFSMWQDHAPDTILSVHASLEGAMAAHPKASIGWEHSPAAHAFPESWNPVDAHPGGDYTIEHWEVQP